MCIVYSRVHIVTGNRHPRQIPARENQLIASIKNGYDSRAPYKTGVGIRTPLTIEAIQTPNASFFVSAHTHTLSMVGCMGLTSVRLVPLIASSPNPV
ncbi:host cell division inhibitor Icd-like protein, partial [Escherichia coli]